MLPISVFYQTILSLNDMNIYCSTKPKYIKSYCFVDFGGGIYLNKKNQHHFDARCLEQVVSVNKISHF